ncbi:hypothetical protein NQ317_017743 [Molorchus minor]|uniref:Spastin/Vps4 C-terminal domain-containing protein n=1 Tax=Molorchus minor TaxID=1323400 RepID=A0ABQ9J1D5_9CUCU|nr:hypothetical protein NQ317_017743 [Molorchus minor]
MITDVEKSLTPRYYLYLSRQLPQDIIPLSPAGHLGSFLLADLAPDNGKLSAERMSHEDVVVNFFDFKTAVANIKPSISPEDLKYFEKLKKELS